MNEARREASATDDEEVSIFELLSALLSRLRLIVGLGVAAALTSALVLLWEPDTYDARVTFTIGAPASSGINGLAGALGLLAAPSDGGGFSPDLYVVLMRSPVILARVVNDSIPVARNTLRQQAVAAALGITLEDSTDRTDAAMGTVQEMLNVKRQLNTGLIELSISSPEPLLSVGLIEAFIRAIEKHNRETRSARLLWEREFIEQRILSAERELREAETDLQRFLATNREVLLSSPLAFERERLNRLVQLKQQIFTGLLTNYEDVKLREVRSAPFITVVEPPRLPRGPTDRRLTRWVLSSFLIGATVGVMLAILELIIRRIGRDRPEEAKALKSILKRASPQWRRPWERS